MLEILFLIGTTYFVTLESIKEQPPVNNQEVYIESVPTPKPIRVNKIKRAATCETTITKIYNTKDFKGTICGGKLLESGQKTKIIYINK